MIAYVVVGDYTLGVYSSRGNAEEAVDIYRAVSEEYYDVFDIEEFVVDQEIVE